MKATVYIHTHQTTGLWSSAQKDLTTCTFSSLKRIPSYFNRDSLISQRLSNFLAGKENKGTLKSSL